MGFIYTKALSVEDVFSKFDTDRDGKISKNEAKEAKNMDIFTNFKVKKGMTLQAFESENMDVYARYESAATHAYIKQQAKVQQWIKDEKAALSKLQDEELKELESELEKNY